MRRMLVTCFAAFTGIFWGISSAETTTLPGNPATTVIALLSPSSLIAEETPPDVLISAAILSVTEQLKQDKFRPANSPSEVAELVKAKVLPLFDVRSMTRLAMAQNWAIASPEQQEMLIAEFKTLLVYNYSIALANYRDQAIQYRPLRMMPFETEVTVRSAMNQSGAERLNLKYMMEKTADGWKVSDIRIDGTSLITPYRSLFAQSVLDGGVDGLIKSLSANNRRAESGTGNQVSSVRNILFIYHVLSVSRSH